VEQRLFKQIVLSNVFQKIAPCQSQIAVDRNGQQHTAAVAIDGFLRS